MPYKVWTGGAASVVFGSLLPNLISNQSKVSYICNSEPARDTSKPPVLGLVTDFVTDFLQIILAFPSPQSRS